MNAIKRFTLLLFTVFSIISCSDADLPNSILVIRIDGADLHYITLRNLNDNLNSERITIFDFVHGKDKTYRAFLLKDVLEYSYGSVLTINPDDVMIKFSALDGFSASATVTRSLETGGYLAFEDLDVAGGGNWEPVAAENNNNPAPLYIVWSGQNQNPTTDGYPWPYQLSTIDLIN